MFGRVGVVVVHLESLLLGFRGLGLKGLRPCMGLKRCRIVQELSGVRRVIAEMKKGFGTCVQGFALRTASVNLRVIMLCTCKGILTSCTSCMRVIVYLNK